MTTVDPPPGPTATRATAGSPPRPVVTIDPLFDEGPEAMVELAHRFGAYQTHAQHEKIDHELGRRLHQRHDSILAWILADAGAEVARYSWDELRFSVSWKAYCFANDASRQRWADHSDDIDESHIVDRL